MSKATEKSMLLKVCMVTGANGIFAKIFQPLIIRRGIPVEEGARTVVYLASSPEIAGETGKYFYKERAIKSDPATYEEGDWKRLWEISEQMTGMYEFS